MVRYGLHYEVIWYATIMTGGARSIQLGRRYMASSGGGGGKPVRAADHSDSIPLQRVVDVPRVRGGVLRVVRPRRVEVGERFRRQHLLLGLALVEQLLDAVVR